MNCDGLKYIWIATDTTKYELPIAVADSCKELAKLLHVKPNAIFTRCWRNGMHDNKRYHVYKIPRDEEREDEQ